MSLLRPQLALLVENKQLRNTALVDVRPDETASLLRSAKEGTRRPTTLALSDEEIRVIEISGVHPDQGERASKHSLKRRHHIHVTRTKL
jgi:hypothetical protein